MPAAWEPSHPQCEDSTPYPPALVLLDTDFELKVLFATLMGRAAEPLLRNAFFEQFQELLTVRDTDLVRPDRAH